MADISVVIPTYNRVRQLKQAVESVLAQTTPVGEIIVVDDGSKEDTRRELSAYGDLVTVLVQENSGASVARNLGMRRAKGEWIAFLDDDDMWLPEKTERQMELITANPSLGLVYCSDYAVDDDLKVLSTRPAQPKNRGDVFDRLLAGNFIFTSCALARRRAIEKAGYMDLQMRFAQDWDLWLKIAAEYPVDFVPEPLVLYRQSLSGCLTRDMSLDHRLQEIETIMERAMRLRPVSRATRRRARSQVQRLWASSLLAAGNKKQALSHTLRLIADDPGSLAGYRYLLRLAVPDVAQAWAKQVLGRTAQ